MLHHFQYCYISLSKTPIFVIWPILIYENKKWQFHQFLNCTNYKKVQFSTKYISNIILLELLNSWWNLEFLLTARKTLAQNLALAVLKRFLVKFKLARGLLIEFFKFWMLYFINKIVLKSMLIFSNPTNLKFQKKLFFFYFNFFVCKANSIV